jgi:hypothetical protein
MRSVILGDLHLSAHTPRAVERDLVSLVQAHPGARMVFVGDFFDLSADAPRVPREQAIERGFGARPLVSRALAEHVERGGSLVFLSGNHDPEMGELGAGSEIGRVLGLDARASERITTSPWFFRDGGLHVEHGHIFDPDNAPVHPLAVPRASLGVHFVEEFIAPTGAYAYLNANDGTPLKLFASAFRWYGVRGPYVVYRYFHAAAKALAKSGPFFDGEAESARGLAAMGAFLESVGATRDVADAITALSAPPTMNSFRDTVARLYLDRVVSTLACLAGASALGLGRPALGATLLGAGALGLAASWLRGHDRYGGTVPERLREGALGIAAATGAKLVVLGHAHQADERGAYANTGSFAFPRGLSGRPLLVVDDSSRATRVLLPVSTDP